MLRGYRTIIVITALLVIGLGWSTLYFEGLKGEYVNLLEKERSMLKSLQNKANMINQTKNARVAYFKQVFFMNYPYRYYHTSSDFLANVSRLAPANMSFQLIRLIPSKQQIRYTLEGRCPSQRRIENFREGLADLGNMVLCQQEDTSSGFKLSGELDLK